ncbi:MAG: Na+/H+ antiporter NhaA [Chloroflexi bacterium]|nr:Na+/H+ antiporter NhaA [Chloroflexota bacterium]
MASTYDQASEDAKPRIERLLLPFQEFAHREESRGLLLLACTFVALLWANSPWAETYVGLWQTKLGITFGAVGLAKPLLLWINDGLMAMFFFVIGLEIKREVLVGELSSPRQAVLPIAAAVGGMVVPALFYLLLNLGTDRERGWGIPMATDIAFALGVLALVGRSVPFSLKMFLTALAVVDDLGAVLVIALFYTSTISWLSLGAGAVFLLALAVANRAGVRNPLVYAALGIGGLWLAFLLSGVHATIAGVLAALAIPARTRIDADRFAAEGRALLDVFQSSGDAGASVLANPTQAGVLEALRDTCEHATTPLQRLEHVLHPWVSFLVMPVFALANAGVALGGEAAALPLQPVALGVLLGLVVGKPVGIVGASWLAVRLGIASMPPGATWRQVLGVGFLGGIGFTMSLFIAGLAFAGTPLQDAAKVGILGASVVAGLVGWWILRSAGPR